MRASGAQDVSFGGSTRYRLVSIIGIVSPTISARPEREKKLRIQQCYVYLIKGEYHLIYELLFIWSRTVKLVVNMPSPPPILVCNQRTSRLLALGRNGSWFCMFTNLYWSVLDPGI